MSVRSVSIPEAPEAEALTELLRSALLPSSSIVVGEVDGVDVRRVGFMAVPDIGPWLRRGQLLITTPRTLGLVTESATAFIGRLSSRGVAALAVQFDGDGWNLEPEMIDAAAQVGLPIVAFHGDGDHPLSRGRVAVEQTQVSAMFEAERVRKLLVDVVMAGGGLAELAGVAARELNGTVLLTTSDGREISRAGDAAGRRRLSTSPALDSTGRLRTDTVEGGLGLHVFDGHSGAIAAVSANHIDHGRLALFTWDRVMTEHDLYLVERAAAVCALVVTRQQAVASVEERHRANFIHDLMVGRAGDTEHVVTHAKTFGWDFDRPLVVVSIEPDPVLDESTNSTHRLPVVDRQAMAFSGAIAHRDPGAAVTALTGETVIVMGVGNDTMALVRDLVSVVRGEGGGGRRPFSVGVSRTAETTDGVPALYSQARTALTVGRRISGQWSLTNFDDLGVYRLLSLVEDEDELENFARETLRELTDDTAEAQDMRNTLEVLLATNINIAETARKLHFHYNTLRYRVVKLEKMLGSFTAQPELRLDLSLALKIIAMRGINH
ncbi:PucR family transcriptional regulator [Rhodococcus kyotonensis]|uniref:helix-turn-helix domain-containing protein n=1 Tax=Nocardiaceae TaxID=85025 RepID=UPI000A8E5006|nr:PucR family transcriptional regulator [Rhodococcus kyotonensis]NIL74850.1 Purine catabolism regulatory protein [Rhodococcus sp. B10]